MEASLRENLAAQLSGAQDAIEALVHQLKDAAAHGGGTEYLVRAEAQRQALGHLQNRIAVAGPAELAALRAEIIASVAASQATLPQTSATAALSARAAEAALHAASEKAHQTVSGFLDDYYEKKLFEPYLRFDSAEDEAAYRKREAERREAIEKALAEGTPEGQLRALELSKEQMRDAGDHGANRSPDYAPMLGRLDGDEQALASALSASPTRRVEVSKAKAGVAADPLDAVAPDQDRPALPAPDLRALGVSVSNTDSPTHGLTATLAKLMIEQGRTT